MKNILFNLISKNFNRNTKDKIINLICVFHKIIFPQKFFYFNGIKYKYFFAPYNMTFLNERAIEIPIALKLLSKYKNRQVLEIGNVLNHYISVKHKVIDKYEIANGVINKDILKVSIRNKYDLIISISTVEHIKNSIKALTKIKSLLKRNGLAIITYLYKYNKKLDNELERNRLIFNKIYFLKQSFGNKWIQIKSPENTKYKILIVGIIKK